MTKLFNASLAFVTIFSVTATAQVSVQVNVGAKRSFAVNGFQGDPAVAGMVTQVLKNDLTLSGHFKVGPAEEAEFLQQGTVKIERGNGFIDCTVMLRATKQVVLSKTYQGSDQDLRTMVHRLSDDIVLSITQQKGIALSKIAFVLTVNGKKELAVMDYDGYNVRQLTHDNTLSVRPRWSPDGKKIVYTSYISRFPDVVEVNLFTGQRKKLASYPGLNTGAVYSPDGSSIALTLSKDGNPELYVMDANGSGLRRLTNTKGAESSPSWTNDGKNIVYVSDDRGTPQVYKISKQGGDPTRLTVSPSYNTEPDWSRPPEGSDLSPMLAVTSRVGGKFQIGIYNPDTRQVIPLIADGADNEDPSWAPDGRHLVFTKTQGNRSQLYLLDVVTREQVQLPALKQGSASQPSWGP
jgi:TolB protein